jgi:hypothetical protein
MSRQNKARVKQMIAEQFVMKKGPNGTCPKHGKIKRLDGATNHRANAIRKMR